MAAAECDQFIDGGDVPIHGEDRVGDDDRRRGGRRDAAGAAAGRQQLPEVIHVPVAVDGQGGAGQPAPVDDAGVVQLVRQHADARATERAQDAEVGGETGREADGGLGPLPFGQRPLQLAVDGAASRSPGGRRLSRRPSGRAHRGRPPPRPDGRSIRDSRWTRTRRPAARLRARPPDRGRRTPGVSASAPHRRPGPARPGSEHPTGCRCRCRCRRRSCGWRGRAATSSSAPIQGIDDPHDLLLRDRQRRHQHHDVAQRTQQHAPGHGTRAHPATPAQPRLGRGQLDTRPSGRAGESRAPPPGRRPVLSTGTTAGRHAPARSPARPRPRSGADARAPPPPPRHSPRRSARGRRSRARGRRRGTRRTPRPTPPWPTWPGTRR